MFLSKSYNSLITTTGRPQLYGSLFRFTCLIFSLNRCLISLYSNWSRYSHERFPSTKRLWATFKHRSPGWFTMLPSTNVPPHILYRSGFIVFKHNLGHRIPNLVGFLPCYKITIVGITFDSRMSECFFENYWKTMNSVWTRTSGLLRCLLQRKRDGSSNSACTINTLIWSWRIYQNVKLF